MQPSEAVLSAMLRFYDRLSASDVPAFDEVAAPDAVLHQWTGDPAGHRATRRAPRLIGGLDALSRPVPVAAHGVSVPFERALLRCQN